MIRARERPQISVHAVEKLYFDGFLFCGNEITEGHFQVLWTKRSGVWQQLVARAGREDHEVRAVLLPASREGHVRDIFIVIEMGFDTRDTRVYGLATGGSSAIEEQSIEHGARVNHQRARHFETRSMALAGNQFGGADFFFDLGTAEQEGIFFDGLVREPAATRLFPSEMLVKEGDVEARRRELFAAQSTGRSSADYGNLFHPVFTSAMEGVASCQD